MDILYIYIVGFFIIAVFMAFRAGKYDFNIGLLLCVIWPITLVLMVVELATKYCEWEWNMDYNDKLFGYRKPNDGWPGFALTVFHVDFMCWKKRLK